MKAVLPTRDEHFRIAQATRNRPLGARLLLAAGVIGPLLFMIVVLLEGATRPGYDAWHHPVSTLSLGPQGWAQVANFFACGVLVLCFAAGLRYVLSPGRGATWGPILIGIAGLGLVGAALFNTDPSLGYPPHVLQTQTLHGSIHLMLSNLFGVAVMAAGIVIALRFAATPGWRLWALYSMVTVVLVLGFAVLATLASASSDAGSPFGLFQRLSIFAALGWIALVAYRLMNKELPVGAQD